MIKTDRISFSYRGKKIFEALSLDIPDGITVIEGPSGGGKTTLLRLIAGLETPSSGTITGVPKKITFMFQDDRLLPWLSAEENVACVMPEREKGRALSFLKELEIEQESGLKPGALSGGQQRRVALARALAYEGDLMILDEPLKGLDPALMERIVPKITGRHVPIIVTSHSKFETDLWGGNVITVDCGRKIV